MSDLLEYTSRSEMIAAVLHYRKDPDVRGVEVLNNGKTLRVTYKPGAEPEEAPEPAVKEQTFAEQIASMTVDEIEAGIKDGSLDPESVYVAEADGKKRKGVLALVEEESPV
jgi:hypothetical protein